MAGFGVMDGVNAAGAVGSFLSGRSQAKASKELLRRQAQMADMQNQQFRQAQPMYQSALHQLAGHAGVDPSHVDMRQPGQMSEQDRLRFATAEDEISRLARARGQQLSYGLQRRGVASGSVGAALANNERNAMRDLAGFRRQLAIQQPLEEERRMGVFLGALNPALSGGQNAANIYGQQGIYAGQQAQNSFNTLGGILANYGHQGALGQYMGQYGVNPGGGGYPYSQYDTPNAGIGAPQGPALPGTYDYELMRALADAGYLP